ncbi:MAG: BspA family leucine-rich repeat surface protein [Mollicutes bacterium]|nr:BspA family leucine-rich repeat surface protein [Mollicutes bacterium]
MKDKKLFISIVSIFTIISFIIGVSYAYFTPIIIGNDTASSHHTKAGTLRLTYNGTNVLTLPNASPGDSASTEFTVTNSGTLPVNNYEIYFSELVNTFISDEVEYTLTCTSGDTNNCTGKDETPLPKTSGLIITQNNIEPNITHTYTLTVTFIKKNEPQDYNQGKSLKFKVTIGEYQEYMPTLMARGQENVFGGNYNLGLWEYADKITEIIFETEIYIPITIFKSWDVSVDQNEDVMAYIIDDGLGTNTYKLFIQANNDKIYANQDMSGWFGEMTYNPSIGNSKTFSKLTQIHNLPILNTSQVVNMKSLFGYAEELIEIDLSGFNTTNVTNMSSMFYRCFSLTSLDLSTFDTSSVITMSSMFYYCSSLTSLDLSTFDTSNVTNMSYMFDCCFDIEEFDFSNFDTSKVTNMSWMFADCYKKLTHLDVSMFDTSNVTNMEGMFFDLNACIYLNIGNMNTSNVTSMSSMFSWCNVLTELDVSSLDTSNVTDMSSMFDNCQAMLSLNLSNFNTTNVTNMSAMFQNCKLLTSLDLSSFNTENVVNMGYMFNDCISLTDIDLRNAIFTKVMSYDFMFRNVTSGINIMVKDVDAQTWIKARSHANVTIA